ncbi:hypothetical protein ACFWNG_03970 [Streptomyces sp. NPDC058391]|uniref:hypothetical protein n=1 Tax=Streptomyces sp. NPDC058391 TaxID=3346476 RepID=UPI003649BB96
MPMYLPAFPGWERPGLRRRFCDRRSFHSPNWCLVKVTDGPGRAPFEKQLRAVVDGGRCPTDFHSGYTFMPTRLAEQLVQQFAALGDTDRLELRRLPACPADRAADEEGILR